MNLYYESMTKIQFGTWTIRIWRKIDSLDHTYRDVDIYLALNSGDPVKGDIRDLFGKLLSCERVNAVEILDPSGHGNVVYKDWP
jgi:hypothetical protein